MEDNHFVPLEPETTPVERRPAQEPRCYYRTGPTSPPKEHTGIVVCVLLACILLAGLAALLFFLNIRLLGATTRRATTFADNATTGPTDGTGSLLSVAPAAPGISNFSGGTELPLQTIYAQNISSFVSITTDRGAGSGVVLTADGYLVTNYHVVEAAEWVDALLTDGRNLSAELVGQDEMTDLAVLKVDATDLIPATFGDSDALQVGDAVAAIGDPLGVELRGTLTDGIVSAINRNLSIGGAEMTLIQTNAALNSGNSGGPLLNCYGQVVGINTAKIGDYYSSAGVEGLGFAIPSNTVVEITSQLISQGYVNGRPELGFDYTDLDGLTQAYFRLPSGAYVSQVASGSPAAKAGLAAGDIVVGVNGSRVYSASDLTAAKNNLTPGETVVLHIYRGGYEYQLSFEVQETFKNP